VPARGWTTITLKDDLVALIDSFLDENRLGYSNRAEVVAAAVRTFLSQHMVPTLSDAQLAVAIDRYIAKRDEEKRRRKP